MIEPGRHQEETPRTTYPLTALQHGMLFHHLLEPDSGVDIEQLVISLPEHIDGDLLARSWEIVSRRHDVLRTSFRWHQTGSPLQVVHDSVEVPFQREDWSGLSAAQREARSAEFLREDRRAGFAMDRAPLFRVALFRCGDAAYQLVWTFHHAILDGRSFTIVLRDVFACYEALERGTQPVLPPAAPPFRDHVAFLAGLDPAEAEAYWRERLRGRSAPTPLPAAFPAGMPSAARHGEHQHALSAATTSALERFAREHGVTVNTLVQGAWALVLARHCGETDVVFGATRACRRSTIAGADDIAGLFINTLPVRVHVDPDRRLIDWLRDLRTDWTALRSYENTPLPQIQRWSGMPAGVPLFESIVVFENRLLESSLRGLGGRWQRRAVRLHEQTNYPLTLAVYGDAELTMKLGYDAARFDDASIARVLGHLATVLEGFAQADGERALGAVPWLTALERRELEQWNATATAYPRDASVAALFAAQAAARPAAIALVQGDRALTYRELDERANQLARRLQRLGVEPNAPVGLCLPRSLEMVVGALGILKAGGAYVPLDPAYPRERLAFLAADTGLQIVLTAEQFAAPLAPGPQVLRLDTDWDTIATESTQPLPDDVPADAPAYIIYTSGSTGTPKGVVVPQRAIVRLVVDTDYADFGPHVVGLAFAPLTFDASTFEVWGPLLNGGRLVVFGADAPTFEDLAQTIRAHGVTTLWLTAALFHHMVDRDLEGLRPLRQLLAGGDVLSVPHVKRVLRELPDCRLINGYGPTENTTFTACFTVPRDWDADGRATSVPIGRPIANTTAYVLDDRMQPVPIGVIGRLYTGGDGVALGYHARPELTAERFLQDPFNPRPGARMYDTGDRASRRPDGTLDFFGRADQQLKIRGFRVEPGEIEAVLKRHPHVVDATVVGRSDAGGTKRLIGYVVPRNGTPLGGEALRTFVASQLPAYMVPSAVVSLPAFPVTANGKLDRAQLPDPDPAGTARQATYLSPRDRTESTLVRIWSDVLGVEPIGIADNFFELGGDSILTIALISRARDAGLRVTPRQLYDHPTVAALAAVAIPFDETPRDRGLVVGEAPLTPVQRWFFESETVELNYWNQAFLFAAAEPLDEAALTTALRDVIAHHDVLRARFTRGETTWRQRFVEPGPQVPMTSLDLSDVSDATLNDALERACVEAQGSLDIERGPLLRALHVRLGHRRGERLLLAIHHLAVDGVSWRLLLEDLATAYDAARGGRPASLPGKTTSFKHWAERLEAHAISGAFDDQRDYWHAVVAAPSPPLPRDVPPGHRDDVEADAETLTVALRVDQTRALLQDVPAAYNTRINDVLLTALAQTLRRWAGTGSLMIDLEGHGREDELDDVDLSRTVGWFTTIFPVRLALSDTPALDQLRTIKEQLRAIPQRGLGYGVLRYLLGDPELGAARPAQIVFNYLGQFDRSVASSNLLAFAPEPYGPWHGPRARRAHPIEINCLVIDGRLELRWSFGRGSHTGETVARIAADFVDALRALIALCTAPDAGGYTPSDFPLAHLDQAQLDAAAGASRDVEDVYPLAPIQALFHVFADPGDDPGFEQWRYRLRGPLDRSALRAAWQGVVDRHPILRTAFVSDGLVEPLQVVHRTAALPWTEHDLREFPAETQASTIERLLREDHDRGFDFQSAPLMRLMLIRLDDRTAELVWSQHHLLVDRWSWPIVLHDVGALYDRLREGGRALLEPAVPYRAYVAWLANQRLEDAEAFWREQLAGYAPPPPFARRYAGGSGPADEVRIDLTREQTAALQHFSRTHQLSLNAVVSGAWALWLGHHIGTPDVVLGLALSGRPADLPGVDRIVGVMINNLPLRVRANAQDALVDWLRGLHGGTVDVQQYASTPLQSVQAWSGVAWNRRLFENLVVFQHAGADDATSAWLGEAIAIERIHAPTRTGYPISLVVTGSESLSLRVTYDPRSFDAPTVTGALGHVRALLLAILNEPEQKLDALLAMLPANERGLGLRRPMAARPQDGTLRVAPRTATEAVIAGMWAELLDDDAFGVTDNFLALGGHSLLAMQLASRLRDTFRLEIPVRTIFRSPTVEGLAQAVTAREHKPGQVERIARLVQRVAGMSLEEVRLAAAATGPAHDEKGLTDAD